MAAKPADRSSVRMLLHAAITSFSRRDFAGHDLGAMAHATNDAAIKFIQWCVQEVKA